MSDWNSSQYLKFESQRTQPVRDLTMRIKSLSPKTVVDIGCGPGNSTAVLAENFPQSEIVGIDNSPNMIEKAKAAHPELSFRLCDALSLGGKYDLLFSNACLQWIPDHRTLLPSLMDKLNENGVLAVQIPMNEEEPLYRIIRETVTDSKWGLENIKLAPNETLAPNDYFNILSECSSDFDIWEVKYYHSLAGHRALIDWVKGTRLRPYLDALGKEKGAAFEKELEERSEEYYPLGKNGEAVFGFRRFFFTAVK